VFSREILQFMRDLDTPEIHGYLPNFGYRVYTEKAIETVSAAARLTVNGHSSALAAPPEPDKGKTPKKKLARRGGNGDGNLPEVGQDELVGRQQPGDAITVPPPGDGTAAEVGVADLTGK
jgi:arginine decarboxylase